MKRFVDMREDIEESNHWMPVSYILAGFVLVIFVLFISMVYFGSITTGKAQVVDQPSESTGTGTDKVNLDKLKEKEVALNAEKARLDSEAGALKDLVNVKGDIIYELIKKFSDNGIKADIDTKTGNIRFNENLLFDVNKIVLNADGETYLKTIMPAYFSVVLSDKNKKYIEQIVFEGHADDGGSYAYNLDLSQKRSYSVVESILRNKLTVLADGTDAEKLLTISGKSFSSPVMVNGVVDKKLSRRVELAFRLKYDQLLEDMQQAFKGGK